MIDERAHLLVCLMEEASEIAECCHRVVARAAKALRFGDGEVQPGQDRTNAQRLAAELADLRAVAERLEAAGVVDRSAVAAKQLKLDAFLQYARECGALAPAPVASSPIVVTRIFRDPDAGGRLVVHYQERIGTAGGVVPVSCRADRWDPARPPLPRCPTCGRVALVDGDDEKDEDGYTYVLCSDRDCPQVSSWGTTMAEALACWAAAGS